MKNTAIAFAILGALTLAGCQSTSNVNTADSSLAAGGQKIYGSKKVAAAAEQFSAGNYGLAQKSYLSAVEASPRDGLAWLGLAASYDQLGRFDLADDAYARLLELEGRKPAILNNYGYSHYLRGNYQQAQSLMNEARAQAPLNPVIEGNWELAQNG